MSENAPTDHDEQDSMKKRTTVDADLEQESGEWQFDEEVARQFDDHVRKSIPLYDHIQSQVLNITDWFLQASGGEHVYDLGCATGTTIQRFVERYGPTSPPKFTGIDVQAPMLEKARERVGEHPNVSLVQADISTHMSFPNATVVTSLFTMSFVRESERQRLISQIYDDLEHGGAFIFVEKTRARSPFFQDIWNQEYWDFKARQDLSAEAILGKAQTLRGQLRPLTIPEYEEMLSTAGFDTEQNVDIFFKWYPWTGIVARKT
jgi:tRNA (cmo5U34)-methyltransferase